jgi:hypothetical protein
MNFIKNKRADKIISVYWFAILIIVAVGIFGMVYVFYGTPYDVREIEANILTNQIADCVSYAGRINDYLISGGKINQMTGESFLKMCHLNFTSSEWEEEQYYSEVNFYNLSDLGNPVLNIQAGNKNWHADCAIQEDKKQENLPQCIQKSFYSLDSANNQYIIKILTAVGKLDKNVKI